MATITMMKVKEIATDPMTKAMIEHTTNPTTRQTHRLVNDANHGIKITEIRNSTL